MSKNGDQSPDHTDRPYHRGMIATLKDSCGTPDCYLVLACFDKYYNKYFMRSLSEKKRGKNIERLRLRAIKKTDAGTGYRYWSGATDEERKREILLLHAGKIAESHGVLALK